MGIRAAFDRKVSFVRSGRAAPPTRSFVRSFGSAAAAPPTVTLAASGKNWPLVETRPWTSYDQWTSYDHRIIPWGFVRLLTKKWRVVGAPPVSSLARPLR